MSKGKSCDCGASKKPERPVKKFSCGGYVKKGK